MRFGHGGLSSGGGSTDSARYRFDVGFDQRRGADERLGKGPLTVPGFSPQSKMLT
jgi:hypothetical protein